MIQDARDKPQQSPCCSNSTSQVTDGDYAVIGPACDDCEEAERKAKHIELARRVLRHLGFSVGLDDSGGA